MPDLSVVQRDNQVVISNAAPESLGRSLNGMGMGVSTVTWPTANKALYSPFHVFRPFTITKLFVVNGGAVSGNIDVGVYDAGGVRLASIGSTAQVNINAVQEFDITDLLLQPGLYYFACAMDNTTGQLQMWSASTAIARILGVCEQTSAFALPVTATFATTGTARVPLVCATQRSFV